MPLIPRWRYMTPQARQQTRRLALGIGVLVLLLVLKLPLPWLLCMCSNAFEPEFF